MAEKSTLVATPDSPALAELCASLAARATDVDTSGDWPRESLQACADAGVFRWFLESQWGGLNWSAVDIVRGYLALSAACLTTTFVITQRTAACRRIADSTNDALRQRYLPELATGEIFATVGISHLTTSRRHLATPVLRAARCDGGWVLDGFSPWVTGGDNADLIVVGASVMADDQPTGEQLLIALPTDLPGVATPPPAPLVGLAASHTGTVELTRVAVSDDDVIQGPIESVISAGRSGTPGGHETSTLALGLTQAALDFLQNESLLREDLRAPHTALAHEHSQIKHDLLAIARGEPACTSQELRQRANSIVLRSTQAALAAAKGTGYVASHPTGRWCREALFFLVWSCPQPVMNANLCELAGLD